MHKKRFSPEISWKPWFWIILLFAVILSTACTNQPTIIPTTDNNDSSSNIRKQILAIRIQLDVAQMDIGKNLYHLKLVEFNGDIVKADSAYIQDRNSIIKRLYKKELKEGQFEMIVPPFDLNKQKETNSLNNEI